MRTLQIEKLAKVVAKEKYSDEQLAQLARGLCRDQGITTSTIFIMIMKDKYNIEVPVY